MFHRTMNPSELGFYFSKGVFLAAVSDVLYQEPESESLLQEFSLVSMESLKSSQ